MPDPTMGHSDPSPDAPEDEPICVDDYPEHDYKCMDERDSERVFICGRCGAETWEPIVEEAL